MKKLIQTIVVLYLFTFQPLSAEIFRTNGELIAGTEGIQPKRRVNLSGFDLRYADLTEADLEFADLTSSNLAHADLTGANLYGAIGCHAAKTSAVFGDRLVRVPSPLHLVDHTLNGIHEHLRCVG